jgi:subtilase family serine protease
VHSDINSQISETNETDNIVVSAPFELLPTPAPDLVPSALATATSPLTFGSQATFTFTESNTGSVAASTVWTNLVTISTDATPSANDQPVALGGTGGSPIAAGGSVTHTVTGTIPLSNALPEGQYWFIVQSDVNASVTEQRENNNATVLGPMLVSRPPLANLAAAVTGVPAEVGAGVSFAATVALTNDGTVATSATTYVAIFAVEPSGVSTLLQEFPVPGAIGVGETKSLERSLAVPQLASSTFTLRVCADHRDAVVESSESDNCGASASVTIRRPNLVVTAVSDGGRHHLGAVHRLQHRQRHGLWILGREHRALARPDRRFGPPCRPEHRRDSARARCERRSQRLVRDSRGARR